MCEREAEEHRVGVCHLPPPPTIGYPGLRLTVGGAYVRSSSPFFVLYHRLYRVSQIDDSIRPTKPTTILHIFRFRCLINLYMFIYFVLLVIVMIYFASS